MRTKRLLIEKQDAVYHVVCRTAFQSERFSDESKKMFVALLNKQAVFSGVDVITYCILKNHVHLLIKVPYLTNISDDELAKRYRALYGEKDSEYAMPTSTFIKVLKAGGKTSVSLRKRLFSRMQNLPVFVKELKQRFGIWFNRRYENKGTLWSDRFFSAIVENEEEVISLVAAYIDMNPVRLKLCNHPKDYPFSNYRNNNYYALLKAKYPAKGLDGSSQTASQKQPIALNSLLKEKVVGMSVGKVIGRPAFIKNWQAQHQRSLKGKSKWLATATETALSFCLTLTEIHNYRKWS